jgi:hypothetical protein
VRKRMHPGMYHLLNMALIAEFNMWIQQAGGVFVDRAFRDTLKEKLGTSTFAEGEMLDLMEKEFERKVVCNQLMSWLMAYTRQTKRLFDGSQSSSVITFGRSSDNDRAHGIIKGKLSLSRSEVADAFNQSVDGTMSSCLKLLRGRKIKVCPWVKTRSLLMPFAQHLLLVGGFGESPYLHRSLDDRLSAQGTQVVTVPEPSQVSTHVSPFYVGWE